MLTLPVAHAQMAVGIGISVHVAPPALPVYVQPPLPAPGYLWTPGYWSYGDAGYYWVPGVWVNRPGLAFFGPLAMGFRRRRLRLARGYWARTSASTVELTTASATAASDSSAASGAVEYSLTTALSPTLAAST